MMNSMAAIRGFPGKLTCPEFVEYGGNVPLNIDLHQAVKSGNSLVVLVDNVLAVRIEISGLLSFTHFSTQLRLTGNADITIQLLNEEEKSETKQKIGVLQGESVPASGQSETRARKLWKDTRLYITFQNSMAISDYLKEVQVRHEQGTVTIYPTPCIAGPAFFGLGLSERLTGLEIDSTI